VNQFYTSPLAVYDTPVSGVSRMIIPYTTPVDATVTQTEALIVLCVLAGPDVGEMQKEIRRHYTAAKEGDADSIVAMRTVAANIVAIVTGSTDAPEGAHDAYKAFVAAWRDTDEGKASSGSVAVPGQRRRTGSSVLGLLGVTKAAPRQTSAIARQRAVAMDVAEQALGRVAATEGDDMVADLRRQLEAAQKRR
jgi:hypothetical protein